MAMLIGSVGAGIAAYEQTFAESLGAWKRGHLPSERVWEHSLGSLGYHRASDPHELARAIRKLPAQLDGEGSVWQSENFAWIAVYDSANASRPVETYCLECSAPPRAWQPAGLGWDAFDRVLDRAEQALKQRSVRVAKEEPRDPRELRY